MPLKNALKNITLIQPNHLQTLTENRRIFNLQHCKLNVFESYEPSYQVPLAFGDFVITSTATRERIRLARQLLATPGACRVICRK